MGSFKQLATKGLKSQSKTRQVNGFTRKTPPWAPHGVAKNDLGAMLLFFLVASHPSKHAMGISGTDLVLLHPKQTWGPCCHFFLLASHPSNMQRVPQGQILSCFTPNRPGDHAAVLFSLLHIPATCKGYLRDRPCPKTIVYAATLRETLQVNLAHPASSSQACGERRKTSTAPSGSWQHVD